MLFSRPVILHYLTLLKPSIPLSDVDHKQNITKGTWDSINVIDVIISPQKKATYKISSSVVLEMAIDDPEGGSIDLSGSLNKAVTTIPLSNQISQRIG